MLFSYKWWWSEPDFWPYFLFWNRNWIAGAPIHWLILVRCKSPAAGRSPSWLLPKLFSPVYKSYLGKASFISPRQKKVMRGSFLSPYLKRDPFLAFLDLFLGFFKNMATLSSVFCQDELKEPFPITKSDGDWQDSDNDTKIQSTQLRHSDIGKMFTFKRWIYHVCTFMM